MRRPSTFLISLLIVAGCTAAPAASPSASPTASSTVSAEPSASASSATRRAERYPGAQGLAFVRRDATSFGNVFVVDDNGSVRQLTELDPSVHLGGAHTLAWSPDGERIAFAYGPTIAVGIGILDADGGELELVGGGFYAWSPDGNRLATGLQLDVGPPGAMNELRVSVTDPEIGKAEQIGAGVLIGWHPDGTRVVVMRFLDEVTPQLVLITVADGAEQELIRGASSATWSPDGSQVAYVVEDRPCTGSACQRIFIADEGSTELSQVAVGNDPEWSPDGTRLAFGYAADEVAQIGVVDLESGQGVELGPGYGASWSPDGRRLAIANYSVQLAQSVMRVVDVDSSEIVAEFLGESPAWRPASAP